jgi:Ca2+-binding RTX toxin-like protein
MQPLGVRSRARFVLVTAVAFLVASLQVASAATTTQDRNRNGASGTRSSATAQNTAPVPIGGGWIRFDFGVRGSVAGPFTFSSRTPVVLSVTDIACLGDRFDILDQGSVASVTSTPALAPECVPPFRTEEPRPAFYRGLYSAGMQLLRPGAHEITIRARTSPFGSGGAFLRVDACTRFLTQPGRLAGTAGNDTLCGSPGNDVISGGAGNDRIAGGRGADLLRGALGADAIAGGRGSDLLTGQDGTDRLFGDVGTDLAAGGTGRDGVSGGASGDALYADGGLTNVVVGDEGADSLFGGFGDDLLSGSSGNDLLQGAGGTDSCVGGSGVDAAVACESLQGIP